MSEETKHKLRKAAPWLLGGAALLVLLYLASRAKGGGNGGQAPVQDLSQLGGGQAPPGSADAALQPAAIPQEIAQGVADAWTNRRNNVLSMRQQWAQQQQGQPGTASEPLSNVNTGRTKLFGPGTNKAQQGGTINRTGGGFFQQIASFVRRAVFGGAPITLGNTVELVGSFEMAQQRGQRPAANGAQARSPGPAMPSPIIGQFPGGQGPIQPLDTSAGYNPGTAGMA